VAVLAARPVDEPVLLGLGVAVDRVGHDLVGVEAPELGVLLLEGVVLVRHAPEVADVGVVDLVVGLRHVEVDADAVAAVVVVAEHGVEREREVDVGQLDLVLPLRVVDAVDAAVVEVVAEHHGEVAALARAQVDDRLGDHVLVLVALAGVADRDEPDGAGLDGVAGGRGVVAGRVGGIGVRRGGRIRVGRARVRRGGRRVGRALAGGHRLAADVVGGGRRRGGPTGRDGGVRRGRAGRGIRLRRRGGRRRAAIICTRNEGHQNTTTEGECARHRR
jgi:hypothetical protein